MLKKGDWIELDFSAAIKDGAIFDTTRRKEAQQAGINKAEPLVVCIGQGMVLKGLDASLEGKELGKEYEVELQPKDAFGDRNHRLIKTVPLSAFREKPVQGMWVDVDGIAARVISVAGGRALLDFNSPLAGKVVIYRFKVIRIVEEPETKIRAILKAAGLDGDVAIEGSRARIKLKERLSERQRALLSDKIKKLVGELELSL